MMLHRKKQKATAKTVSTISSVWKTALPEVKVITRWIKKTVAMEDGLPPHSPSQQHPVHMKSHMVTDLDTMMNTIRTAVKHRISPYRSLVPVIMALQEL